MDGSPAPANGPTPRSAWRVVFEGFAGGAGCDCQQLGLLIAEGASAQTGPPTTAAAAEMPKR